jgi:hypothetical protein
LITAFAGRGESPPVSCKGGSILVHRRGQNVVGLPIQDARAREKS